MGIGDWIMSRETAARGGKGRAAGIVPGTKPQAPAMHQERSTKHLKGRQ